MDCEADYSSSKRAKPDGKKSATRAFYLLTPALMGDPFMKWIAQQLGIGSWKYLSNLLGQRASDPTEPELGI